MKKATFLYLFHANSLIIAHHIETPLINDLVDDSSTFFGFICPICDIYCLTWRICKYGYLAGRLKKPLSSSTLA